MLTIYKKRILCKNKTTNRLKNFAGIKLIIAQLLLIDLKYYIHPSIYPLMAIIFRRLYRIYQLPYPIHFNYRSFIQQFSTVCLMLAGLLATLALYYRTTNIWTLKNLADAFLSRQNPTRLIILGAFHRNYMEQNVPGNYVV